jgi:hypothetical protein
MFLVIDSTTGQPLASMERNEMDTPARCIHCHQLRQFHAVNGFCNLTNSFFEATIDFTGGPGDEMTIQQRLDMTLALQVAVEQSRQEGGDQRLREKMERELGRLCTPPACTCGDQWSNFSSGHIRGCPLVL